MKDAMKNANTKMINAALSTLAQSVLTSAVRPSSSAVAIIF